MRVEYHLYLETLSFVHRGRSEIHVKARVWDFLLQRRPPLHLTGGAEDDEEGKGDEGRDEDEEEALGSDALVPNQDSKRHGRPNSRPPRLGVPVPG